MAEESDPFDVFSVNIGRLCHVWADLELTITQFFVSATLRRVANAGDGDVHAFAMADCLDFRDKVSAIKVGVVAAAYGVSTRAWCEEVVDVLNYIDNQLRPRRNRIVHDLWRPHRKGARRLTVAPKIYRPQSKRPLTYKFGDTNLETADDILGTSRDVRAQDEWIWELMRWRYLNHKRALAELLAERPLRPLLHPQQGKQRRLGKG